MYRRFKHITNSILYVLTAIMPDREISLPVVHHFNQNLNSLKDGKQRFLSRRNRKTKYFSNRGNKARRILERMREVITGMVLHIIWSISYGPYDNVDITWPISYGSWTLLYLGENLAGTGDTNPKMGF